MLVIIQLKNSCYQPAHFQTREGQSCTGYRTIVLSVVLHGYQTWCFTLNQGFSIFFRPRATFNLLIYRLAGSKVINEDNLLRILLNQAHILFSNSL
jgi:hypothetical protein